MKKLLITLLILLCSFTVSVEAAPTYAKWGKIAVEKTKERYAAEIIDYKHIGRSNLTSNMSEEKFKLWIRSKTGKEFGVLVVIQFEPSTEIIHSIQFTETEH